MTKKRLKKQANLLLVVTCGLGIAFPLEAQAEDSAVFAGFQTGAGPQESFISYVIFNYTGNITSVTFTVAPKAGSFVRPLSATFLAPWFTNHAAINGTSIYVPVFGLLPGTTNTGSFSFKFSDGGSVSLTEASPTPTSTYEDQCSSLNGSNIKVTQQNRTTEVGLGFNYYLLKDSYSLNYPAILDTDGNIRWVGQTTLDPTLKGNLPTITGVEPAILYTPPAIQNTPDTGNPGIYTSNGLTAIYRQELYGGGLSEKSW